MVYQYLMRNSLSVDVNIYIYIYIYIIKKTGVNTVELCINLFKKYL